MVDEGEADASQSSDEEQDSKKPNLRRLKTSLNGFKAKGVDAKGKKTKTDPDGHIVKYSASAYKSTKGSGDVLKKGKYEPFAYIQLNPKMLNKRNKKENLCPMCM